ncbi:5'-deoxynucleotidase HDDC2 [Lethenteron reissneri]|uniref:5'-deoxynucleotidase HDDC2 n=1 Tax=Lethenteron reissneri TaxID=7753 RepID=UPI002AB7D685|nr:5'-deoxynucleotidase HDDC2 [Lethenteron reissneri]
MASGATRMQKLFEFIKVVGQLKNVKRTGWIYRRVPDPESVADHMYRMAILAFLIRDECLNKDKCMKLALVHDMAESIVGDIAPADNVSKEEKHRREEDAMKHISTLVDEEIGKELYSLWEEYEYQRSAEAKLVKDLDRFEMIFQAYEYEQTHHRPGELQDFYNSTEGKFQHPEMVEWDDALRALRSTGEQRGAEGQSAAGATAAQPQCSRAGLGLRTEPEGQTDQPSPPFRSTRN